MLTTYYIMVKGVKERNKRGAISAQLAFLHLIAYRELYVSQPAHVPIYFSTPGNDKPALELRIKRVSHLGVRGRICVH